MTLKVYEDKEGRGAIYRQGDEWGDHLEFESVVESLKEYRVGYMCFNVDWLDKEHYEWFCYFLTNNISKTCLKCFTNFTVMPTFK